MRGTERDRERQRKRRKGGPQRGAWGQTREVRRRKITKGAIRNGNCMVIIIIIMGWQSNHPIHSSIHPTDNK